MVIAGVAALVSLVVLVASLGYLHLAPTGLSPIRNAVSQYGICDFRAGYRVATLAFAAAAAGVALALSQAVSRRAAGLVALLLVFAAARAAISWFPMDAPGAERTSTGTAHGLLATAAFGSAAAAALRLGTALAGQHRWHALAASSTALGWIMLCLLAGLVARRLLPALGSWFGLVERGFYLAAIAWFTIFAAAAALS